MYCIYMHRNKINNKKYIGQTKQEPPSKRWGKNGVGYKDSTHFYNAIQKYGWNNFEHIILETNLTLEQANEKEKFYIEKYNTTNEKYGYNLRFGGNNTSFNKETRQKMSIAAKNRINRPKTLEKYSYDAKKMWMQPGHRENMSKKMKQKWKDIEYRNKVLNKLNNSWTEERKQKASQNKIGNQNSTKKIKCVETGEVFNSIKEAANSINRSITALSLHLHGKTKSCGQHLITKQKLHWKFM